MKRRRTIGAKTLHPGSPRKESGERQQGASGVYIGGEIHTQKASTDRDAGKAVFTKVQGWSQAERAKKGRKVNRNET